MLGSRVGLKMSDGGGLLLDRASMWMSRAPEMTRGTGQRKRLVLSLQWMGVDNGMSVLEKEFWEI